MDTLAVFRSRSEAIRLYTHLRGMGYAVTTINTPPSLGKSCSLSVCFANSIKNIVSDSVKKLNLNSFVGIYNR